MPAPQCPPATSCNSVPLCWPPGDLEYRMSRHETKRVREAMSRCDRRGQLTAAGHPGGGQTTNLQRLAEPSQLLKSAIVHHQLPGPTLSWPPGPCLSSPSCSMMRTRSVRACGQGGGRTGGESQGSVGEGPARVEGDH